MQVGKTGLQRGLPCTQISHAGCERIEIAHLALNQGRERSDFRGPLANGGTDCADRVVLLSLLSLHCLDELGSGPARLGVCSGLGSSCHGCSSDRVH